MSPLVRSLLALAALLVTAQAHHKQHNKRSHCVTKLFGQDKGIAYSNAAGYVHAPGETVQVPDPCSNLGKTFRVGETVTACNKDPHGQPPDVYLTNPPSFDSVEVQCTDGCRGGVIQHVISYCDFA